MKFQLPQFIQTEVKLVGPFTLRQFLWVAAGAATLTILFIFTRGIWFIILAIPVVISSIGFAFVKVDGLPLINVVAYMLSYALNPRKYTYKKEEEPLYQPPANQNKE